MATKSKVDMRELVWLYREAQVMDTAPELWENNNRHEMGKALLAAEWGDKPLNVLRSFSTLVFGGTTPPPNMLVFIAERLKAYLEGDGEITLDEAFNLQSKQRIGHPLKHNKNQEKRMRILYSMFELRNKAKRENRKLSIESAASEALNVLGITDVNEDSLVKNYIELEIEKMFEMKFKIRKEIVTKFKNKMK